MLPILLFISFFSMKFYTSMAYGFLQKNSTDGKGCGFTVQFGNLDEI